MSYTRSQLVARINSGIQGRQGILIDKNETANDAVREVINQIDLSSLLRQSTLAPNLFTDVYDYAIPPDLKSNNITDIPAQVKRADGQWFLVSPEEFDRTKSFIKGQIAVDQYNGIQILKIASAIDDRKVTLSSLDSLIAGGGTWVTVGDLTGLAADTNDYVAENGSLAGNIGTGGTTTAGIKNTTLNSSDLTLYLAGNGACFVFVKIVDPTNITNYQLNFGSSASAYYSKTTATQANGYAFVAGWNLLRFDLTSLTTVGSPDKTKITYASVFMNKTAGKISETGYKFDSISFHIGQIFNVRYYSRYGWQSSTGTYKENSTNDSDVLVCDSTEYNLFIHMGKMKAAEELKEWDVHEKLRVQWEGPDGKGGMKKTYVEDNPSLSMIWTDEYYSYRDNHNNYNYDNNISLKSQ